MKCFYHRGDLDGIGSGAIITRQYPECEMIGVDYGDEIDNYIKDIKSNETVYIVDFTLEPFEKMIEVYNKCGYLVWIDHHISSHKAYEVNKDLFNDDKLEYIYNENKMSGVELTWRYFHDDGNSDIPVCIKYLSLYDTWQHVSHPNYESILDFEMGAISRLQTINDSDWDHILHNPTIDLQVQYSRDGKIIREYLKNSSATNCKDFAFDLEFEGIKFIAMNTIQKGSHQFESAYDPKKHDAMMRFAFNNNNKWIISMYTDKKNIDLSIIAVKYGGGGHAGACGIECDTLPFEIKGLKK